MSDEFITPAEFAWLVLLLGAPVILVSSLCQLVYLRRYAFKERGLGLRPVVAITGTAAATYVVSVVAWIAVQPVLLDWPGAIGSWPFMIAGLFFVPAVLAAIVVVPFATWLARRWAPV